MIRICGFDCKIAPKGRMLTALSSPGRVYPARPIAAPSGWGAAPPAP